MNTPRREFLRNSLAGALLTHAGWHASAAQETLPAPAPATPPSPFLEGNFAPVHEEVTADNLRVIGALPRDLEGMFVRNGPNPQFPPRGPYHWFDGDGMLHGLRLQGGRASYRNRYLRTSGWQEERQAGCALWSGLMAPPDLTQLAQGRAPYKNAANTALVWHHQRLLALWEGGNPHEVRVPDLSTRGEHTFGGRLNHPCTAHPKVDPITGEMMFFGYGPVPPYLRYSVANAQGAIVHTTTIDLPRPVMIHDFAITARHTLFLDLPETMSLERLLLGEPLMRFQPELGARIGILSRRCLGRDICWFPIEPCFVFHTLAAWDDGDEVVLVACRMADFPADIEGGADAQRRRGDSTPRLHRWRCHLPTGRVREERLDDAAVEFPRFNETLLGRPIRYGYAGKARDMKFEGFVKFDLATGRSLEHAHGPGRFGGEGVFVPRPGARAEDAGWLLTFVHDERENRSELVVVDAQDFRARPLARVLLPQRVPYGFHGLWLDNAHL